MKKLLALVLILTLFGCTNYQEALNDGNKSSGKVVVISDYRLNPQVVSVKPGETITWKNLDKDAHSLLFNNTESDLLEKGETYSIIAPQSGTFEYSSGNHPFIKGKIVVQQ